MKKKRYNHAFTIAFECHSNAERGDDVTGAQLRNALLRRLRRISDEEMIEACGLPYDTFEEEDEHE